MTATPRIDRGVVVATAGVVLLSALASCALGPASARALPSLIPNPLAPLRDAASDAAAGVGGGVLKDALEWLLGGLQATITLELVKFLTTIELPVGGALDDAAGPVIVIGGLFLVVGLITSIGDGYGGIVAGTDTAPRVIGAAVFRVVGLALLLGSWFWLVPLAVDVANGMSSYVLSDEAVGRALRRTFAGPKLLDANAVPLLWVLTAVFMTLGMLVLVVLKFVIAIAFACLYVGGPALIGFAALPRVGRLPLALATRGLVTLMLIPLAWTVVFVAWAGVSAAMFEAATGSPGGVVRTVMGPGLFLAGLVVMLAITKRVLSMASFGLPLSTPGVGIVRSAARLTAARAATDAAGGAAAAALGRGAASQEGEGAKQTPTKGGQGTPIRAAQSGGGTPATAGGTGDSSGTAGRPRHKLFEGREAASNRQAEWNERLEHRARVEEAEKAERARDVSARGSVSDGVFQAREAPREDYEPLADRADEVRTASGIPTAAGEIRAAGGPAAAGIPTERVREAGSQLGGGDRSALAAGGLAAMKDHPDDPEAAWRQFRHLGVNQYAGRAGINDQEREAVVTILAAGPDKALEAFREDYDRYRWKRPHGDTRASTGDYDPELFRFALGQGDLPDRRTRDEQSR